jgi:hypothetical protein
MRAPDHAAGRKRKCRECGNIVAIHGAIDPKEDLNRLADARITPMGADSCAAGAGMQMRRDEKACPCCGETILAVARKCKHCGEWLEEKVEAAAAGPARESRYAELREIAVAQKNLLFAIFGSLFSSVYWWYASYLAGPPEGLITWLAVIVTLFQGYAIYNEAAALGMPSAWLFSLGSLFPVLSFLLLLIIDEFAQNVLRKAGLSVGLFGVKLSEIDKLRLPSG